MPHFFLKMNAVSSNPGRWTHERVRAVSNRHHGKLQHLWHDDPDNPKVAYVLIEDGDLDGLTKDLQVLEVVTLHTPREQRADG
jgi:hypothetical protein